MDTRHRHLLTTISHSLQRPRAAMQQACESTTPENAWVRSLAGNAFEPLRYRRCTRHPTAEAKQCLRPQLRKPSAQSRSAVNLDHRARCLHAHCWPKHKHRDQYRPTPVPLHLPQPSTCPSPSQKSWHIARAHSVLRPLDTQLGLVPITLVRLFRCGNAHAKLCAS